MDTISSKELAKLWLEKQHLKSLQPELFRLKSTGIKRIDDALGGGIEPGQYVVFGGAQKSGKTTLMSCVAESFAKQGLKILYLSGEMTTLQMATMFFSRMTNIDRTRIRAVNLDQDDWNALERAADELSEYNIWWNHGFTSVLDIDEIVSSMEAINNITFDAIFIDYIQLMEAPEMRSKGNRTQELEFISRALKHRTIGRKRPCIVVVAAQLNRESIRGNLMDANAFLGSGSIERDMDIGLIIHSVNSGINNEPVPDKKRIVIVGSRETGAEKPFDIYYNGKVALLSDFDSAPRFLEVPF